MKISQISHKAYLWDNTEYRHLWSNTEALPLQHTHCSEAAESSDFEGFFINFMHSSQLAPNFPGTTIRAYTGHPLHSADNSSLESTTKHHSRNALLHYSNTGCFLTLTCTHTSKHTCTN